MNTSIVVQPAPLQPKRLILLFHGVGADANSLLPLGQALTRAFPEAMVVSVEGPHVSDLGRGRQWFSVIGITEQNRPARIEAVMAAFQAVVHHWQEVAQVDAEHTTLVGFSQGAIMALESTQQPETITSRVLALAGRFAVPPRQAAAQTIVHLIHGEQDRVIAPSFSVEAARRLQALGSQASLDLVAGLGHEIDARVVACAIERLRD